MPAAFRGLRRLSGTCCPACARCPRPAPLALEFRCALSPPAAERAAGGRAGAPGWAKDSEASPIPAFVLNLGEHNYQALPRRVAEPVPWKLSNKSASSVGVPGSVASTGDLCVTALAKPRPRVWWEPRVETESRGRPRPGIRGDAPSPTPTPDGERPAGGEATGSPEHPERLTRLPPPLRPPLSPPGTTPASRPRQRPPGSQRGLPS